MKNRYEALLVLDTQGRDDTVKDVVDRLEAEFQKEGAEIEQIQKMDRRPFLLRGGQTRRRVLREFCFSRRSADSITKLRAKFKLDPEVYRQHYQRLRPKTERPAKKLAEAK